MQLSLSQYIRWVKEWSIDPIETVHHYFQKAQNSDLNTFVHFHKKYIDEHLESFAKRDLCAAPIGIKDLILTKGYETSACSQMLSWYVAPYSASCFEKLELAWWLMIGKTNMDDSAMGTTNESSIYGPVKNPCSPLRVSWWSSWWSAAAVASDECLAALWTDTGWSIRLPAAWCGIVGLKPTYGRVSRYGVSAMSSSLDQVGVLSKNVEDAEIMLRHIAWYDPKDMTSKESNDMHLWQKSLSQWISWIKIWVPKQFFGEWLDPAIAEKIQKVLVYLKQWWAEIIDLDIPLLDYWVMTYYIICPAEVSSNMARFEWMRFWHQKNSSDFPNIYDYFSQIRTEWLGKEVKRRILIGGYVLSSWHIDQYYNKARAVQTMMRDKLDKIYENVDIILGPTTPTVAPYLWQFTDDPIKLYLMDIYTVIANLWWYPAMSIPVWRINDDNTMMPVWCQIMAARQNEKMIFQVWKVIENFNSY